MKKHTQVKVDKFCSLVDKLTDDCKKKITKMKNGLGKIVPIQVEPEKKIKTN